MDDLYNNPHGVPEHDHGSWSGCLIVVTNLIMFVIMEVSFRALEIIRPGVISEAACGLSRWLCP